MALFKKMLKKEKKENVLQPAQMHVEAQAPINNELDLNNVSSLPDENESFGGSNELPDLDLPDFDSLLDDSNVAPKMQKAAIEETAITEDKNIVAEVPKPAQVVDESVNEKVPSFDEDLSLVKINDSINIYDGDYFVSLGNYKSICDRLKDFDENVKDLNKISDEFFSLHNGKETILKNSDNSYEEIHRKILLIDGICFKDD